MALRYVNLAVLLIAHLVGLIVAIILLIKVKGTPSILATVAFALALLRDLGQVARAAFLDRFILEQVNYSSVRLPMGGLDCCCGIFSVVGTVCLIVAIWQAVSATAQETPAEGAELPEEATEGSE